ncbi:hypothetical protein DSOL_3517 [Desulfosporosinus metallidurans]|uniref:Uncharacterized protein n=1 Tax=Desulfosporosinus metallidurans TaxID=1888891 RepID=A0A1Q8QQH5_9FIRM|nr:hypothetical protein DSOL_3517 [Desulfosporosinus metallidurans]
MNPFYILDLGVQVRENHSSCFHEPKTAYQTVQTAEILEVKYGSE